MCLRRIRTLFTELGDLDLVRLCGPDPLARSDLLEVAETILESSRPSVLHLTTPGQRPEAAEAFVCGLGPVSALRVLLEVDGGGWSEPETDVFDSLHWRRLLETAKRLRAAARERPFKMGAFVYLAVETLQVNLRRARAALAALDIDLFAVPAPMGPGAAAPPFAPWALLEAELDHWEGARGMSRVGVRYFLRGAQSRCAGDRPPRPRPQCTALRSHIHVNPDGSVPTCSFRPEEVGQLSRDRFQEVWFGPAAESARADVDGCTGCWSVQETLPNALYTGDIVRAWRRTASRAVVLSR